MSNQHKKFWDTEYTTAEHLALSTAPSEDLQKYTRWMERNSEIRLNGATKVLDLGTGNGRNLIWLSQTFGCRGVGIDISKQAITQAIKAGEGLPLTFAVKSMAEPIESRDGSFDIVLDMMSSHFLHEKERLLLRDEIARVLRPGGSLFFKGFLLDEDKHAARMLRLNADPEGEKHAYIHPRFGVYEHVWTIDELEAYFKPLFEIKKIEKSHKHIMHGKAFKRRTMTVYLERCW
jgi:ubiquinone/menaquinone biosynthesis C-methylase UbiE